MALATGRLLAASWILSGIAVACAATLVLRPRPIPARPPHDDIIPLHGSLGLPSPALRPVVPLPAADPRMAPLFATLVPAPTPTPTPTPVQPVFPKVEKVIASWRVSGLLGDAVLLHDVRNRIDWEMRVGDTKAIPFGAIPVTIHLDRIDETALAAEFWGTNADGRARKSLFDE